MPWRFLAQHIRCEVSGGCNVTTIASITAGSGATGMASKCAQHAGDKGRCGGRKESLTGSPCTVHLPVQLDVV
jgi:hypothetical protein